MRCGLRWRCTTVVSRSRSPRSRAARSGPRKRGPSSRKRRKLVRALYEGEFRHMTREPVPLTTLTEARERLVADIHGALTDGDRAFLLSVKGRRPDWSLIDLPDVAGWSSESPACGPQSPRGCPGRGARRPTAARRRAPAAPLAPRSCRLESASGSSTCLPTDKVLSMFDAWKGGAGTSCR